MKGVRRGVVATVVAVMAVLAGLTGCSSQDENRELVVGASEDPAMRVMAAIYAGALRNAGAAVSADIETGDDRTMLAWLGEVHVDLFPAFTGSLVSTLAPDLRPVTAEDTYNDLNRSLPQGVSVGDATPVSAVPQVFVATSLAQSTGAGDLASCDRLPAGLPVVAVRAPAESTVRALADAGCRLGPVQVVPDAATAFERIATGTVAGVLTPLQVAGEPPQGPSGAVQALRVPEAKESAEPSGRAAPSTATPSAGDGSGERGIGPRAEDLVPVYRTVALSRDQVKAVNKVAGEITTADLAGLAQRAATGTDPAELASGWLGEHGL